MALSRAHKLASGLCVAVAVAYAALAISHPAKPAPKPDTPGSHRTSKPIDIRATPIPLDDRQTSRVGALIYRAGYVLTADAPESWGGWSDMLVVGDQLTVISDRGIFLTATLDLNNPKKLLGNARYTRSFNEYGAGKIGLDAESIISHRHGYLVGFEQYHRVALVKTPGHAPKYLPAFAAIDFSVLPDNGGLEAMARTAMGDIILFAERGTDTRGFNPAWIVRPDNSHSRISYQPPQGHAPTAAATLPNGDMLVLNRAFSPLDGTSIKLSLIKAADVGTAEMMGHTIAHLTADMNIDNFEALAVLPHADGTSTLLMLSDDNFNRLQRTILLAFDLELEAL